MCIRDSLYIPLSVANRLALDNNSVNNLKRINCLQLVEVQHTFSRFTFNILTFNFISDVSVFSNTKLLVFGKAQAKNIFACQLAGDIFYNMLKRVKT